eukprot:8513113-Lingulodinium_polyedra.AAC.1
MPFHVSLVFLPDHGMIVVIAFVLARAARRHRIGVAPRAGRTWRSQVASRRSPILVIETLIC